MAETSRFGAGLILQAHLPTQPWTCSEWFDHITWALARIHVIQPNLAPWNFISPQLQHGLNRAIQTACLERTHFEQHKILPNGFWSNFWSWFFHWNLAFQQLVVLQFFIFFCDEIPLAPDAAFPCSYMASYNCKLGMLQCALPTLSCYGLTKSKFNICSSNHAALNKKMSC